MKLGHSLLAGAVAATTLVFASMTSSACGGSGGTGVGGGPDIADVVYGGGATDEALEALLDATPVTDASQAATFTAPTNGATIPSDPAPVFTWKVGAAPANAPPPPAPTASLFQPIERSIAGSGPRSPERSIAGSGPWSPERFIAGSGPRSPERSIAGSGPRSPERSWSDRAASGLAKLLLGDVRAAWAHGTPTSGAAYFVVFSTSKDAKLLRVFTTETSYTPAATELAKLKTAGEAIHAIVTHAEFDQNRIATDGGPFQGTEITFTLQ